jgi:hypothetical protein
MVIVLAEDDHHERLIVRYLKNCGLTEHDIRVQTSPSGRGSAQSWVLKNFVRETSAYRNRQSRALTALIVITDADTATVQNRLSQLDQALQNSGKPALAKNENIARLIPKRNVETWILCLNGESVNEQDDYKGKRKNWDQLIPLAAKTLHEWMKSTMASSQCVNSLASGIGELKLLSL